MNEQTIIKTIESEIGHQFIGDDCAYLKKQNIVVSQDSLIEDIHFKREWFNPFQLGYKSVAVNISDILASGAKPEYITIALSIPNNICEGWENNVALFSSELFVQEFYKGAKAALNGAIIVGGDITGSKNSLIISISAIGSTKYRKISSRSNAKIGYAVVVKGAFGSSDMGLKELLKGNNKSYFVKYHISPEPEKEFSEQIAKNIRNDYAMMDTSDGLADALFKIAEASKVKIHVDYDKIPHMPGVPRESVLFGGEDYKLVAVIPNKFAQKLKNVSIIGKVEPFDGTVLEISDSKYSKYSELQVFNHFN